MPLYTFQTPDGEIIEQVCPMAREGGGPSIGDEWVIDGRRCVRVPERQELSTAMVQRYPFLSNALPPTVEGCKIVRDPKTGRAKPLIRSKRHQEEVRRMNNLVHDDG